MAGKRFTRPTQASQVEEELNSLYCTEDDKNFHIIYTNADCLTNKKNDLIIFLDTLKCKPSAIVITEVNSKCSYNNCLESEFIIPGYNLFSVNVSVAKKRGIIVYVESSLSSSQIEIVEPFSEYIFIKVSLGGANLLTIGAFYRSPSSSLDNDRDLFKLLDSLNSLFQGKLLLIGDFNLPNIRWSNIIEGNNCNSNSVEYKFISCLNHNNLLQHVQFPTRARASQTPHVLDLIITNDDFVEDIINLSPLGKSDHSVLQCICNLSVDKAVNLTKFNFNKGDYDGLRDYLSNNIDSCVYDDHSSINESWMCLKSLIEVGQELFIPHITSNNWNRKNWRVPISKSLRDLIKKKHKYWTKFQASKDKNILNEYKRLRNQVRKESRLVTLNKQKSIALSCKNNPKVFWQHVRSKIVTPNGIGDIKLVDGKSVKVVTLDSEKAEIFSDYFSKIYTIESETVFEELAPVLSHPNSVLSMSDSSLVIFSEDQVASKLRELKINKSPGPDLIHPRIIYEARTTLVGPLTYLFNKSMRLSALPDEWRTSIVTVLHKKGRKDCIDNYRPISLTCICCKIMESLVTDFIMSHLLLNNLLSSNQYGFIKKRSTVLQLLKLTDDWTKSLDDNVQVDIVYTDFEKAFDKVPHHRLISKLKAYGLDSTLVAWIRAFLTDRFQKVKINREFSDNKEVLSGIPQGSVLGPLLFIIYINDLPLVCDDLSKLFLFADDAKMYRAITSVNDYNCLNQVCKNIHVWSEQWLMKLNTTKCKVMSLIRNKSNVSKYDYAFDFSNRDVEILEHVDSFKDLGVLFDCELTFEDHIYGKINVASKMLGIIRRNFVDLDKTSFILLYKCMVRSHLEYAGTVWNPYRKGIIKDIESIQKEATKLIRGCKGLPYNERLSWLQLPTLKYRRFRGDMIEVYKILNNFYDPKTVPKLELHLDSRTRGHSFKLKVDRCNFDVRKFSFCNRVVKVWNSLPNLVVTSDSINVFKRNLDNCFKKELIYYDYEADIPGYA